MPIEKFCASGVFDAATYSQGIKVTQPQAILFLSGQVAYTADGSPAHRGDPARQQRSTSATRPQRHAHPRRCENTGDESCPAASPNPKRGATIVVRLIRDGPDFSAISDS